MAYLRFIGALLFALALLLNPARALEDALQAARVWMLSFAPALFPFFAVNRALSSSEAQGIYRCAFGRFFARWFGCPGQAAGAVLIGWMAGSPAGAIALSSVEGLTRAQRRRAALLASGVSPAFLVSVVGAGLLGDAALGAVLLRAQLGALVLGGWLLRRAWPDDGKAPPVRAMEQAGGMKEAALNMLTVCGYMMCFGVLSGLVGTLLPFEAGASFLLAALEVSGGCAALCKMELSHAVRMALLAGCCCFGSISLCAQNTARLEGVGVGRFLLGKLLHALLGAALCLAQLRMPRWPVPSLSSAVLAALCVLALATGMWYNGKRRRARTARL